MLAVDHTQPFTSDRGADDRQSGREGFQNLQTRAASGFEWYGEHRRLEQMRRHRRHHAEHVDGVSIRKRLHGARHVAADDSQPRVRNDRSKTRHHLAREKSHRGGIGRPRHRSDVQERRRRVRASRGQIGVRRAVDAVGRERHGAGPEPAIHARLLVGDGEDGVAAARRVALAAPQQPRLVAQIHARQLRRLFVGGAPGDRRIHVVEIEDRAQTGQQPSIRVRIEVIEVEEIRRAEL